MIKEILQKQIEELESQVKDLEEELDRCDGFDGYAFEKKQQLRVLRARLDEDQTMFRRFEGLVS